MDYKYKIDMTCTDDEEVFVDGEIEVVEEIYEHTECGECVSFMYTILTVHTNSIESLVWVDDDNIEWVIDLYEELEDGVIYPLLWKEKH